jgi:alpha-glucosidase
VTSLLDRPHHDGSEAYVLEPPGELGDDVTVLLRVPREAQADEVVVRFVHDGEPRYAVAAVDRETESETWWRATFRVDNPMTPYRWLLSGGSYGYAWLNGTGVQPFDVADADDFVVTPGDGGPGWHLESVVYEVFPDRFASSGREAVAPEWAVPRDWDELPTGRGPDTPFEWFGGDLLGIEAHLDHIASLGANVLYLTPVFPAASTHRYDATTFDAVDPLLGGDEALESLVRAAHARGMRVLGDLTTNHVGAHHEWFRAASNGGSAERDFFVFDEGLPHGYECWWGIPSLPKLDYRSQELRERMFEGEDSVVRRWLRPPYDLDGWRIDVANMTGRLGAVDVLPDVARGVHDAAVATRPDALVVAEHAYDVRADLRAGGWHGAMNYAGFTRPVWTWLRGDDVPPEAQAMFFGAPVGVPRLPGESVVRTMSAFRAGVPWSASLHSWSILDSHDVIRFRTLAGSRDRQLVGVGLQMTTPGVPMVFAGAEIGLEGAWGEDARRTMPWSRPETWDASALDGHRQLIALRRSHRALARGGIRYVHVSDDVIAYVREARDDAVLCLATRETQEPIRLPLRRLGAKGLEALVGEDASIDGDDAVLPRGGPAFHAWRLV